MKRVPHFRRGIHIEREGWFRFVVYQQRRYIGQGLTLKQAVRIAQEAGG